MTLPTINIRIKMEAETQFVYSQSEFLLQNIWHFIPLRTDSTFSSQIPITSDHLDKFNLKNQQELPACRKHELLAMNGFIDRNIAPGFRYKVREVETQKKLFNGQAKYLESIGQGYGKRLTFESDDVLENDNFFWTDSNEYGYAFSIEAVSVGDVFIAKLRDTELGFAKITKVQDDQKVVSSEIQPDGAVKRVKVDFQCKIGDKLIENDVNGNFSLRFQGVATLVKGKQDQRCKIQDIKTLGGLGSSVVLQPVP